MKKFAFASAITLAFAIIAFAHGNMEHILGAVTAVSDHSITLKTTGGETKTIEVVAGTKLVKGDAAVTLKDIHVGDRVAIHAGNRDGKLQAEEIKIGVAPAAK
jgi:Cu/Ag efflux protein CusF